MNIVIRPTNIMKTGILCIRAPIQPKPKTCRACRSVKEPFIGHDIYNCPNIAEADRANLLKSFSLGVDDEC